MATELIDVRSNRGWDSLVPFTQPSCMGIPHELLIHHLRLSAIEFCERSGWFTQSYLVDLQENVDEYPIDSYDCMRFIALRKVCYNGDTRYCPAYEPNCCSISGNKFWYENGFLRIGMLPIADEPGALRVEIVAAPSQDTCFLPESLYRDWAETIAMGAIARCLSIAGQVFYDLNSARTFEFKFRAGATLARQRVERSRIRGPMKMTARRFV